MKKSNELTLTIVSQEKELLNTTVDSVTAPASEGQVTILPQHIPLFSRLDVGELIYRKGSDEYFFVVSKGFIDVGTDNSVTIIVDTALDARSISVVKAQQAIEEAKKTMSESLDRRELLMAEASLKQALLEIQIAQKSKKTSF